MIVMGFAKLDKSYPESDSDGIEDDYGGEAVLPGNKVVSSTASVAFGQTYGKILALAYIKAQAAKPSTQLNVVVAGDTSPARVLEEPVHDPESLLPRKNI